MVRIRTYPARYSKFDKINAVKQKTMKASVDAAKLEFCNQHCMTISTNRRVGAGTPTVLATKEEKEIVAIYILQVLQDIGFGLPEKLQVLLSVTTCIANNTDLKM